MDFAVLCNDAAQVCQVELEFLHIKIRWSRWSSEPREPREREQENIRILWLSNLEVKELVGVHESDIQKTEKLVCTPAINHWDALLFSY